MCGQPCSMQQGNEPPHALVVQSPSGMIKMSEVINEFVYPSIPIVPKTHEGIYRVIAFGVIAWNIALAPAEEQDTQLDA
jgi:hypothetical protein